MMRKLTAGNWKMNGTRESLDALQAIASAHPEPGVDILICPPATLLLQAAALSADSPLSIGAQDCHSAASGAHTGDISAPMIADAGAQAVRRAHHHIDIGDTPHARDEHIYDSSKKDSLGQFIYTVDEDSNLRKEVTGFHNLVEEEAACHFDTILHTNHDVSTLGENNGCPPEFPYRGNGRLSHLLDTLSLTIVNRGKNCYRHRVCANDGCVAKLAEEATKIKNKCEQPVFAEDGGEWTTTQFNVDPDTRMTLQECKDYAQAVGKTFTGGDSYSYSSEPRGCFTWDSDKVYYNNHATSTAKCNYSSRLSCVQKYQRALGNLLSINWTWGARGSDNRPHEAYKMEKLIDDLYKAGGILENNSISPERVKYVSKEGSQLKLWGDYVGSNATYTGSQNTTRDGTACVDWNGRQNNNHHNYCRNPDDDANGMWCFTGAGSTQYGYCDPLPDEPTTVTAVPTTDEFRNRFTTHYDHTLNKWILSTGNRLWEAKARPGCQQVLRRIAAGVCHDVQSASIAPAHNITSQGTQCDAGSLCERRFSYRLRKGRVSVTSSC